jgi:lambda family phage minor tail protein L
MSPPINTPDFAAFAGFKNALATGARFVWLYEIEVPTSTPTRYRFCAQTEPVTFDGNEYSPFPITHSSMQEGADGDLPTLTLTVSNISREIAGTLETYNGLIRQPVKIMLVLMTNSYDTSPQSNRAIVSADYKITSMSLNDEAASASLGDISLYEVNVPKNKISKRYCRFAYKGAQCGYAGLMARCDKSLDGPMGCRAHASDSPDHPNRFGGFPGAPTKKTGGLI